MSTPIHHTILLTFDIEDWFQVENFKELIPVEAWPDLESRVKKNTHLILDLLDEVTDERGNKHNGPRNAKVQATFFILGWIAERFPEIVTEIHSRGHEVASHGYGHDLIPSMAIPELRQDLIRSKKLLEDISGSSVAGYRAPSFSITQATLELLHNCGYQYDSSFNSFSMNKRYGHIDLSLFSASGIGYRLKNGLTELPISNLSIGRRPIPWGGGGYFRLLPFTIFKHGVFRILKKNNAFMFYLHPWEFDPEQPIVREAAPVRKFRHYLNLSRTYPRLKAFIQCFEDCEFLSCRDYLNLQ